MKLLNLIENRSQYSDIETLFFMEMFNLMTQFKCQALEISLHYFQSTYPIN
jgi:hypothetical protein